MAGRPRAGVPGGVGVPRSRLLLAACDRAVELRIRSPYIAANDSIAVRSRFDARWQSRVSAVSAKRSGLASASIAGMCERLQGFEQ